ncbi:MAG: coenzyme F420-0:L-glutamate ligase [Candidatus Hydrothermarchaeales archaeon]
MIEVIGIENFPIIKKGDSLGELILASLKKMGIELHENDILVITEKIVSKAEGRLVELKDVVPSEKALKLAEATGKDPRIVELILRESCEVLAVGENFIIVETRSGFVMANAGVDESNVDDGTAKLLPLDPDRSAKEIKGYLERKTRRKLGVIISDSLGRPFRHGSIGVAIGASGLRTLWDRRGEQDMLGKELMVTRVAVGDCLASAANLVMGEAAEMIPVVVIRGFDFSGDGNALDLIRPKEQDVFRRKQTP